MEIFALSPRGELEELAASLKGFPAPVELRPAESGLVMARGRIGGDGSAFNLGEILVSRCCLSVDGIAGFGYVLSGDLRHAELCALLDALGSRPGSREAVAAAAEELGRRRLEEALRAEEEAKKTKVEFFTMVRGDD
ncbi:MAG: phosphonate C-P lyase system protein PhnG [Deltaproteobacteria bacterium]|jgi:alpha-D-ribose 1-methylphosphonate 5-triphosphate synthase subunit PhnG|nr:phosphonate C-P lyase system protein PhnG [Deltaproteobacteria bacterium]